jgi:STE24 endopeptidase
VVLADNTVRSSPKAVARHSLTLPLRIEQLLIYPLFLFLLQYSGLAVGLRAWLAERVIQPLEAAPLFERLDRWLSGFTRGRLSLAQVVEIALYITLVTLFITILFLPLSFYQGFVLAHQFGLSTQTFPAWLRDFLVGQVVGLVITLGVFGGFYAALKLMPRRWPFWFGAGYAVLTFGYILLEPLVITPLFYTVTPVTDEALLSRIYALSGRAGMTVDDIFTVDASSKTTAVNAYVTGFGGASKIGLWDTLLSTHPPDEVDVVLAHEMGHWYYRHVLIFALVYVLAAWVGFFLLRIWLGWVWQRLGWRGPDDVAGYPYLLALLALVSVLTLPPANGLSRFAENQADQFALEVARKPAASIDLFHRLAEENLAVIDVPAWEKFLFYTHPPIRERLERAQQALEQSP